MFTSNIRKRKKKCDLSDFDHGVIVGLDGNTLLMRKVREEWPGSQRVYGVSDNHS